MGVFIGLLYLNFVKYGLMWVMLNVKIGFKSEDVFNFFYEMFVEYFLLVLVFIGVNDVIKFVLLKWWW